MIQTRPPLYFVNLEIIEAVARLEAFKVDCLGLSYLPANSSFRLPVVAELNVIIDILNRSRT